MERWQQVIALIGLAVVFPSVAVAGPLHETDVSVPTSSSNELTPPSLIKRSLRLELPDYRLAPDRPNFIDHITFRRVPPGSLRVIYRGPWQPIMRQAHKQYRRLWSKSLEDRLPYMEDHQIRALNQYQANAWADLNNGGQWGQRSWMDALPPEKGGAPATPYVHIIGSDNESRIGPFTISNTLKVKLDYIAVFDFEADPDTRVDPLQPQPSRRARFPLAIDFESPQALKSRPARLNFAFRPSLRVGLPKDGDDWKSMLRNVSARAEINVSLGRDRAINIECEARMKNMDEFVFTVDLAVLTW